MRFILDCPPERAQGYLDCMLRHAQEVASRGLGKRNSIIFTLNWQSPDSTVYQTTVLVWKTKDALCAQEVETA